MINLTLDTSCFDKNSKKLLYNLKYLQDQGLISVWHELRSEGETDKWISPDKEEIIKLFRTISKSKSDACCIPLEIAEDEQRSYEYMEKQRGYTTEELHKTHVKIDQIMHPAGFHGKKGLNKYTDGKLLALHIVRGRDIFVTKDERSFIRFGKKEKLEQEFPNIKIRILNKEFIDELKSITKK